MKVAIAGGTGFVGSRLVERLLAEGHQVLILTRNPTSVKPAPNVEVVAYNLKESGAWQQSISGCDAVVNLAGEPIAEKRWTPEHKQEIINSRKIGTQKIVEAISKANPKPSVLVSASAIGYYGSSETATFEESSPSGNDFLAQVCQEWEAEAQKVKDTGTRLVIVRIGIVLGMGGVIGKMIPPFKMFAGGPIGTGKQWFSWIHRDDLVNLILFALKQKEVEGVLNATAPNPVRMNEVSQTLGEVLNRPSWLPVPAFALEVLLGDGAQVVLEGQQVLPKRTITQGFNYQYPTLKQALEEFLD
ncbi:TIGR01777 family protein [Cyanobacteria bacterium FACHB-472]|nr:TIGR01777 family protein [Cyanobacteria bacterium FACHB-472]